MDAVQNAGPKPTPTRIIRLDVQRASAEFENALQHVDRQAKTLRTGKRAVEFDPVTPGSSGEFHAREFFPGPDLQIRKRFVVLEINVKTGLDILDQARFHEQGVHVAVRGDKINVGDELDQVAGAFIFRGRKREIMPRAIAQVLRLADIHDSALAVLHEVHAGACRELFDLLARKRMIG